jgi:hydroxyacylglutathione hydrolase
MRSLLHFTLVIMITQALSILTVPAFDDNYLWIAHNGKQAIVVDPGDAGAIVQALQEHNLSLSAILLTHHHPDHTGGVPALQAQFQVPVYGPANDGIEGITHALHDGETLTITSLSLKLAVMSVPGHTLGHIAYYAAEPAWLFCGDTLFAGGCGRLFEGTPTQMLASLDRLAALPENTLVYCAHEYTLSNLRFAQEVEPDNLALSTRIALEQNKRAQNTPTVPSELGLEKQTNPFLRIRQPSVQKRLLEAGKTTPNQSDADNFAALREWKNHYR